MSCLLQIVFEDPATAWEKALDARKVHACGDLLTQSLGKETLPRSRAED